MPEDTGVNMSSILLQGETTSQKRCHSFPLDLKHEGCQAELAGPPCKDVFLEVAPSWRKAEPLYQGSCDLLGPAVPEASVTGPPIM